MKQRKKKRSLLQWLGLLGVISFLSYLAAVVICPRAYPGYDWMRQAVSDLSAETAPSRQAWNQIAALYNVGGIVSVTLVCVFVEGKLSKTLRTGIYLFALMNWISSVGYAMFPLSQSGYAGSMQDIFHVYVVTTLVILLSIVSLAVIIVGGIQEKAYSYLAVWAAIALFMMFVGAAGTGLIPKQYFGIIERCSVFAATGFNAVLGISLFLGFPQKRK